MLGVVLSLLGTDALNARLHLNGEANEIQFGTEAVLTASCASKAPSVAFHSPKSLSAGEVVRAYLRYVPTDCIDLPMSAPCVGGHADYPALFSCVYAGAAGQWTAPPVSAHAEPHPSGRLRVFLECESPSTDALVSIAGVSVGETAAQSITVSIMHNTTLLPFEGVAGGDVITILPIAPPPSGPPSMPPTPPPPPMSPPPTTPPMSPPMTPPLALRWFSNAGSGSGNAVWTPTFGNGSPSYTGAVVASVAMPQGHIFFGDFDVVITVFGHAYIAMDAVYGSAVTADLVIGAPASNEWGYRGINPNGDGTSKFPGLNNLDPIPSAAGGYHWPQETGGANTNCFVIHSRFSRQGNNLRLRYFQGAYGDDTVSVRSAESDWSDTDWPLASPGHATLNTGDGVVLTAGEAANSPCNIGGDGTSCPAECSGWSNLGQYHVNLFHMVSGGVVG